MSNKKRFHFTIGNPIIFFSALILVIFGSLMIASAEMGNMPGDTSYLIKEIKKQLILASISIFFFLLMTNFGHLFLKSRIIVYQVAYVAIFVLLLITRLSGSVNGAYAWIYIGGFSFQPSELAKTFMIVFGAKLLGTDYKEKNIDYLKKYCLCALGYFFTILIYQSDLGSAVVLMIICYCITLIPPHKETWKIQAAMFLLMFGCIALAFLAMSDLGTRIIVKVLPDYMGGRFLAANNPFLYQYDYGYHLIMSLATFVSGGIFGLGYGKSIHKSMNFPNPSSDFILPVIVEELGFIGFSLLIIVYFAMLITLAISSTRAKHISSKIVMFGTFLYFVVHFILNVGGVSGLIPLTGVPLLLISSGGSSLLFSLIALGISQSEIVRNSK